MRDLIDTTEMYLKTIYEMIEDGVTPMRARIVERLEHSGPTVSQTIARMERDGLVTVGEGRVLEFTSEGHDLAREVVRKHRLAERLLLDVIGLRVDLVHEEACRWEHVMSKVVEERLTGLLPNAEYDPYGNPVPGAGKLNEKEVSLASIREAVGEGASVCGLTWSRLGEPAQADAQVLEEYAKLGVKPGWVMCAEFARGQVQLHPNVDGQQKDEYVAVPEVLEPHVFVERN